MTERLSCFEPSLRDDSPVDTVSKSCTKMK